MKPLGVHIPLGANPILCSPLLNRYKMSERSMISHLFNAPAGDSESAVGVGTPDKVHVQPSRVSMSCNELDNRLVLFNADFFQGAMAFYVEYSRWLEEYNRQINEVRSALNCHACDTELCSIVDVVMAHYEEIFRLKSNAAKVDVFHLLAGMWKTLAERCLLWLGSFRSSEIIKNLAP
ncbi:hypothetical protein ACFE04_025987 [Oxalis oulophora]